uniref:ARAD1C05434p n=1 Tax=Blastobotrys adeninivorans TaxID=409370 RepID=A0A060T5H2_BLAAD
MFKLSDEQIQFYQENGFLVVPWEQHKMFDQYDIQKWTAEMEAWPRVSGKWMHYDEINSQGERQLMRMENFTDYHPKYQEFVRGDFVGDIFRQLTGQTMYLFKDKINMKKPYGGGFGAHTDAPAYEHMGDIQHCTCNAAIDAATPENGCLEVVKGSHKVKIPLDENHAISKDWENAQEWVPVPLNVGDLLFFGSFLAHRSGPNTTAQPRRQLYATFHSDGKEGNALRDKYYVHRRETFPPDHERVPGKDYSEGIKRYAWASPFATDTPAKTAAAN